MGVQLVLLAEGKMIPILRKRAFWNFFYPILPNKFGADFFQIWPYVFLGKNKILEEKGPFF